MRALILIVAAVIMFSCSDNNSDNFYNGDSSTNAPYNISGKTLELYKSNGSMYLCVEHYPEPECFIPMDGIDYLHYPPEYSYERIRKNEALYSLQAVKVTYIPYYQSNYYSQHSFSIGLSFSTASSGTYSGTTTNSYGEDSYISGTFTLY